jgi:hypothetical protein
MHGIDVSVTETSQASAPRSDHRLIDDVSTSVVASRGNDALLELTVMGGSDDASLFIEAVRLRSVRASISSSAPTTRTRTVAPCSTSTSGRFRSPSTSSAVWSLFPHRQVVADVAGGRRELRDPQGSPSRAADSSERPPVGVTQ